MAQNGESTEQGAREQDVAERGRLLVTRAAAGVRAGDELRARIAADRERLRPVRRRRTLAFLGAAGAALAALVVTLVFALGGVSEPPTVLETADAAAAAEPTLPAPRTDSARPVLLRATIDGVTFPEWRELNWPAVGMRLFEVDGREAMTVVYEGTRSGALADYTILAGDPIEVPDDAVRHTVNGQRLAVLREGDRRIVVWTRDGHTCVMSAPATVKESRLLDLAAWDAGGSVPF